MSSVKRTGQVPVWQQIADELRQAISDGTMPPGTRLPTESDLTERFQVARNTARQALSALVGEGLIVAARPRGYFVRDRKPINYRPQQEFVPHPRYAEMDRFIAQHSAEGREARQAIEVSIVDPPQAVRERLHLADGELAVVRRRVRYLDGEPFNTNDTYFPLRMVQNTEIMRPDDITRGANEVLAEAGYRQVRALDEFYIRMPTPDEARRLALLPGTPIAFHVVTGFTKEDMPVRVVLNVLPGDRHVIAFERTRPTEKREDS